MIPISFCGMFDGWVGESVVKHCAHFQAVGDDRKEVRAMLHDALPLRVKKARRWEKRIM